MCGTVHVCVVKGRARDAHPFERNYPCIRCQQIGDKYCPPLLAHFWNRISKFLFLVALCNKENKTAISNSWIRPVAEAVAAGAWVPCSYSKGMQGNWKLSRGQSRHNEVYWDWWLNRYDLFLFLSKKSKKSGLFPFMYQTDAYCFYSCIEWTNG